MLACPPNFNCEGDSNADCTVVACLEHHKARLDIQSIAVACAVVEDSLEVVGQPRQLELGIVQELEHQVGNQLGEVVLVVEEHNRECHRQLDHQQDQQQHELDHLRPCVRCHPPSCVPSTPFGSP